MRTHLVKIHPNTPCVEFLTKLREEGYLCIEHSFTRGEAMLILREVGYHALPYKYRLCTEVLSSRVVDFIPLINNANPLDTKCLVVRNPYYLPRRDAIGGSWFEARTTNDILNSTLCRKTTTNEYSCFYDSLIIETTEK